MNKELLFGFLCFSCLSSVEKDFEYDLKSLNETQRSDVFHNLATHEQIDLFKNSDEQNRDEIIYNWFILQPLSVRFDLSCLGVNREEVVKIIDKIPFEKEKISVSLSIKRKVTDCQVIYVSKFFGASEKFKKTMQDAAKETKSHGDIDPVSKKMNDLKKSNESDMIEFVCTYVIAGDDVYVLSDDVWLGYESFSAKKLVYRHGFHLTKRFIFRKFLFSNNGTMRITCPYQGFSDHPFLPCGFYGLCVTLIGSKLLFAPTNGVIKDIFESTLLGRCMVFHSDSEDTDWLFARLGSLEHEVNYSAHEGEQLGLLGSFMILATLKKEGCDENVEKLKALEVGDELSKISALNQLNDFIQEPVLFSQENILHIRMIEEKTLYL